MKKNKPKKHVAPKQVVKPSFFDGKPILQMTLKVVFLIALLCLGLYYSDDKGYFNPEQANNHTKKKWDAFYKFTKHNNVDVLLMGNSHLYTGINPKNLSANLAVNSFILASPGTNIADTYFGLKEALTKTEPKLVVIETYGINEFDPYKMEEGSLSDQFKSFYARKNKFVKLVSTPLLFNSENYFYAWSNTIRNHDFIFNDTTQLSKNKVLVDKKPEKNKDLYLGRYVRFQTGVTDSLLAMYDSLGAPVHGDEYAINNYAQKYVSKIVTLCEENDIELMFLTLPMYHEHVDNYPVWSEKLGEVLNDHSKPWLNMQSPYDSASFTTICFENTYAVNQHMTYNGSLVATYKLADFINSKLTLSLPNRATEKRWKKNFYGEEGYFDNFPVASTDKENFLICEKFKTNNVLLKEVSVITPPKGENKILLAKVDSNSADLSGCTVRLQISYIEEKQLRVANIDLAYDFLHKMPNQFNFKSFIKPVEVKEIRAGILLCK